MNDKIGGTSTIIGLAAVGPVIVGVVGFLVAFVPLLSGDFVGAGLLFIASGLSLGLLSIAVLGG